MSRVDTLPAQISMEQPLSITEVLANAKPGEVASTQALIPLVYNELRALAGSYLKKERAHTLQPTALVHEAFLKMVGNHREWAGKDHFKAVAAKAMRQVLVDHYRMGSAAKRGGKGEERARAVDVTIENFAQPQQATRDIDVQQLDELLTMLAKSSPRVATIAEMRLFGGMEVEQIARVMGVSDMTIKRDWQVARAWLAAKVLEQAGG